MVKATVSAYAAKREYDNLGTSKPASQGELLRVVDALTNARKRARAAEQAFEWHVATHHCSA